MKPFKAYDVRGTYPDEVNEELAYNVGRAFAVFLNAKKVAVGYDMRESSPALLKSLLEGLTDQGADIANIGMVPTPVLNFAVSHYKFDGGIMISASHNPSNYNAFKLVKYPVLQISSESGMDKIEKLAREKKFPDAEKGKITEKSVLNDYVSSIAGKFRGIKKMKVVADYGNGMGALTAKPVFEKLGIDAVHLYPEPDPKFPHHEANPHDLSNFRDLQEAVKKSNAGMGIFFDGDADRSYIVDEKGEVVLADVLFCLVISHELEKHPGEKVYYDLRFTKAAKEVIEKHGGIPVMMRVGNPFYKEKLVKEGGIAASEFSGHVMFKENNAIDDGLFAALKVIRIAAGSGKTVSELVKPFMKYPSTPEINMKVEDPDKVMEKARRHFSSGKHIELDGVYIQYPEWWFSLRKSRTEPIVRLRVEASSEKLLNEKKKEIINLMEEDKK